MADARRNRRNAIISLVILAVIFMLSIAGWVARFYTDALWFGDLGQSDVFWTVVWSRAATGAIFTLAMFALLYVNVVVARRMAPRAILTPVLDEPQTPAAQFEEFVSQVRARLDPIVGRVLLFGSMVIAFLVGWGMNTDWALFQLAFNAVPFGRADPQFGRDVSFFVFTLPALRAVEQWLFGALIVALLVTLFVHVVDGAIRPWARLKGFAPHVKAHVSVLIALIVLTRAWNYYLSIWELDFSPRGQVTGASYTDINAQLPAYRILIVIALVSAVILLLNIRQQGWRLPAIALGVWAGAAILVGAVYPAIIQQFVVAPNEIKAELPYIERNINSTREAFGLEVVKGRSFPADENLTAGDVLRDRATLQNVRLWDPTVTIDSFQQLQGLRLYYHFDDLDIDRYVIDGELREVLLSVRELDVSRLADQAQTWVNQHLVFTHGYGVVMSPVNESTAKGGPVFIIRDVPPTTVAGPEIDEAGIYFGEQPDEYVVVNTGIDEFDYPLGDQNATTRYAGEQGVPVGNLLRRIAFALRFGSVDFLLSGYITPESRVLYQRAIDQRLGALVPWLSRDSDPYPVIIDGRVEWIIDGYTTSDHYPYSQRLAGPDISYIRNSVKVAIDAYDGDVTLYAFDPKDPILATWRKVFPTLFTPSDEIPEGLAAHFRYPEDLFRIQAVVYQDYHMTDTQTFYNKEDSWALPRSGEDAMDPYYVLLKLPGEEQLSFLIMQPFTPRNKDNMIGWMAAKSDPGRYGERIVYNFPKQKLVLGPAQVEAAINQDSVISPQLSLWNQRGSSARFGNLLVIPTKDAVVYIQPLYLQAEKTAIPELTRVIVVYADKVVMEDTLRDALLTVFGEVEQETPDSTGATATPGPAPAAGAAAAQRLFEQAVAAQRRGDWAEYGRLLEELGKVLASLAGTSTAATPTP